MKNHVVFESTCAATVVAVIGLMLGVTQLPLAWWVEPVSQGVLAITLGWVIVSSAPRLGVSWTLRSLVVWVPYTGQILLQGATSWLSGGRAPLWAILCGYALLGMSGLAATIQIENRKLRVRSAETPLGKVLAIWLQKCRRAEQFGGLVLFARWASLLWLVVSCALLMVNDQRWLMSPIEHGDLPEGGAGGSFLFLVTAPIVIMIGVIPLLQRAASPQE